MSIGRAQSPWTASVSKTSHWRFDSGKTLDRFIWAFVMYTASAEDIAALELLAVDLELRAVELELARAVSIVGSMIPQVSPKIGRCSTSREQSELSEDAIVIGRSSGGQDIVRASSVGEDPQENKSLMRSEQLVQLWLFLHHVPPHDTTAPSRARGSTVTAP